MQARIYIKPSCPFCIKAQKLLMEKGIETTVFDVSQNQVLRTEVATSVGGYRTVPMVFMDDKFIGGCDDLMKWMD